MPYTVLTVPSARFSMKAVRFGEGARPLVILPGLSLRPVEPTAASVAGAYSRFAKTHTVTLFDRRSDPSAGYTVRDMAEDTAEAMTLLGISHADLFGVSQGGMIALHIAAEHPSLVRKLALGSTAARLDEASKPTVRRWLSLAEAGDVRALNRDFFRLIYSKETLEKYAAALPILEAQGTAEDLKRFIVHAKALLSYDASALLPRIACPALVLASKDDAVIPCSLAKELAAQTGGSLFLYEGYGHAVYDEAPDYKDRLARFFEGEEK